VIGLLACVASGALYFLSTNLGTAWPLAWIAPVPVLVYALGTARAWLVLAVAFAAYFGGELSVVPVYGQIVPLPILLGILAIPALGFSGATLLTRRLVRSLLPAAAVFVFPALWTSWEYLFSLVSKDGTILSVAYSQVPALPLIQIASITGIAGITFVLCLVPSGAALAMRFRSQRRTYVFIPACVLGATLIFGAVALRRTADSLPIRVGLAASDLNNRWFDTRDPKIAMDQVTAYLPRIEALSAAGAQLVVLPEMLTTLRPEWAAAARGVLAESARAHRVTVVAGFNEHLSDGGHRNVADVFSPEGKLVAEYLKERFLPEQDDFQRGRDLVIVPGQEIVSTHAQSSPLIGVAICKDMDFPIEGRRYSRASAGLLLVPAWDFNKDGLFHAQMAWLRGVEGGFAVVRSAANGLMSVTDSHGRVLASAPSSAGPNASLLATVYAGTGNTIYSQIGDAFSIACLVLAAIFIVVAGVRRRDARGAIA
jgi:apolipoprotein N-acyltransferase